MSEAFAPAGASGRWVIVCGPSGAGKDAVLGWARGALAHERRVVFARRLVTRPTPPGSEDDEASRDALHAWRASGGLAWYWEANGHAYGVRSLYRRFVHDGCIVVLNGSREHAASVQDRDDVHTVLVTADAGLLHERLHARGRESRDAIAQRLARNATVAQPAAARVIVNDGSLEPAGACLRDHLLELCR